MEMNPDKYHCFALNAMSAMLVVIALKALCMRLPAACHQLARCFASSRYNFLDSTIFGNTNALQAPTSDKNWDQ